MAKTIATSPKFAQILSLVKTLNLKLNAGNLNPSKFSALSLDEIDAAIDDAVKILNDKSDHDMWYDFDALSEFGPALKKIERLEKAITKINAAQHNASFLQKLPAFGSTLPNLKQQILHIAVYSQLVVKLTSYVHWFRNIMENKYARENRTTEQIDLVRKTCDALGLQYDESQALIEWAKNS